MDPEANEIVSHPVLSQDEDTAKLVLSYTRDITHRALDKNDEHGMLLTLKRVVRLLQQMSAAPKHELLSFADELHSIWAYKEQKRGDTDDDGEVRSLINFMAQEAPPSDFLEAINKWTAEHKRQEDTIGVLQAVLKRGTRLALNSELSGSLLRLRRARQRMEASSAFGSILSTPRDKQDSPFEEPTVWNLLSTGALAIDK